jgi:glutaconate CoA-transferase, subunit A
LYITALARAVNGAAPLAFHDQYGDDEAMLSRYATLAQSQDGFHEFIVKWCAEDIAEVA